MAKELYRQVEQVAADEGLAIAAEAYSKPPNTVSLKFYRAMGYREIGTQYSIAEGKTVTKLMKYAEQAKRKA